MKKLLTCTLFAIILMIGCPFLAVTFAGGAGMGICFILFFVINPVFSLACGILSGINVRKLWSLPIIVSVLYLAGVWIFFDMGEPDFLLYAGAYLVIAYVAMLVSYLLAKRLK